MKSQCRGSSFHRVLNGLRPNPDFQKNSATLKRLEIKCQMGSGELLKSPFPTSGVVSMRRILCACLVVLLPVTARAEEPLVEKVRRALDRGVQYLKSQQVDRGAGQWNWENDSLTFLIPGGSSCLAMLALKTAGVPTNDPVVSRGLPYIRSLRPEKTYVVGLQTMVLAEVGDPKDLNTIQNNVNWLIDAAKTRGGRLGNGGKLEGWGYSKGGGERADNSNTQYALLGLLAGRQAGAVIEKGIWEAIHEFYVRSQLKAQVDKNGADAAGWPYVSGEGIGRGSNATLTMTAAGLCGLYIAALEVNENKQGLDEKTGIAANCGKYPEDDALARGLRWFTREFRYDDPLHTFYNVYGIERVGRLSGNRFFGEHDWYREGCEYLTGVRESRVLTQRAGGEWNGGSQLDNVPVISTSFAVLFLAKGRMPILISKFAYDKAGDRPGDNTGWNRKHHDARNLVDYSSREIFKKLPLAWQAFDPRLADLSTDAKFNEELSSLLQSPILYINGHEAPNLTPAQKKLLRRFVDEGGFIFAEACCGSKEFTAGFKKLMEDKLVFGDESPLMPVDINHPIWSSHTLIPAKVFQGETVPDDMKLMAIERGCKTVVVFSPQPLAGYWEEARFAPRTGEIVGAENRGKLAFRLAGNIIAYATGFEPPKPRLDKPKIIDNKEEVVAGARYLIELAQIRHDGGDWQPAKNALRVLAASMRDQYQLDVALAKVDVPMTQTRLWQYKFLYMHGRARFTADDNEIGNIRAHLDVGGTILADACCGKKEFDDSFREFARKVFPDARLEPIPEDDELFGEALNGRPLGRLRCRMEKADGSPETNFQDVKPMLEGIRVGGVLKDGKMTGGRWAIIYSKYDIGCALEKNKSSACKGYDPDSALKLAQAALLYSLKK
jgi:Domain of unknown function (DUF4159)